MHPVGSRVEVGGFGFVVTGIDGPISAVGTGGPKKMAEGQYLGPFEDPVGEMIDPQVVHTMTMVFDIPVSVRAAAVEFRHIVSKTDLDSVRVAVT